MAQSQTFAWNAEKGTTRQSSASQVSSEDTFAKTSDGKNLAIQLAGIPDLLYFLFIL